MKEMIKIGKRFAKGTSSKSARLSYKAVFEGKTYKIYFGYLRCSLFVIVIFYT